MSHAKIFLSIFFVLASLPSCKSAQKSHVMSDSITPKRTVSLKARDNSAIEIEYVPSLYQGDSGRMFSVDDVTVKVSNQAWISTSSDVRVELVVSKGADLTYDCKATQISSTTLSAKVPADCNLLGDEYSKRYFRDNRYLIVNKYWHGGQESYEYQIAVVRNGQWMEDPEQGGAHNFNFTFIP